jgi:hypothetical protein
MAGFAWGCALRSAGHQPTSTHSPEEDDSAEIFGLAVLFIILSENFPFARVADLSRRTYEIRSTGSNAPDKKVENLGSGMPTSVHLCLRADVQR